MAASFRVTVYPDQAVAEARRLSTPGRVEIAHMAAGDAQAAAPVLTGEYRDGIGVEVSGDQVSLVDRDKDSFYKEYGTSDTPAHAVLTNAAKAYGRYTGYQPRR
ncbi:HK97 gp10 family phage protein [Amycolatopsis sp. VS8301801F10]|uniref:HK97 gp10 family phage protein n=1 Tax=unclassified Amycolatopsis TaxID=2618356 RepID=UPI0038FBFAE2